MRRLSSPSVAGVAWLGDYVPAAPRGLRVQQPGNRVRCLCRVHSGQPVPAECGGWNYLTGQKGRR